MKDTTSVADGSVSGNDMLDGFIYAILILFVLSTITEKFVQLIRHYPKHFRVIGIGLLVAFLVMIFISPLTCPEKWVLGIFDILVGGVFVFQYIKDKIPENRNDGSRLFSMFDNIEKSKPGVSDEEKEKEVTALSFLIGFIVAYAFNAPMFKFFMYPVKIGWGDVVPFVLNDKETFYLLNPAYFGLDLGAGIGFLLTGFFLTFGSKFFHELLETLYTARSLKQTLKQGADAAASAEVGEINKAVKEIKQKLIKVDGVVDVSLDTSATPPVVVVGVNETFNKNKLIPTYLFYTFQQLPKRLAITTQRLEGHQPHGNNQPGDEIANSEPYPDNAGSLGFVVTSLSDDNKKYMLTCYHVVKAPDHAWNVLKSIGKEDVLHPYGGTLIGKVLKGYRDSMIDIALVEPLDTTILSEDIPEVGRPVLTRALNEDDKTYRTRLRMYGMKSKFKEGYVFDLDVPAEFPYYLQNSTKKKAHRIFKLIKIKSEVGQFSQGGDSGSLIVDEYNYAVGVLVGGNKAFSYAMPIEPLLEKLQVTI